jgi:hypothetical protein
MQNIVERDVKRAAQMDDLVKSIIESEYGKLSVKDCLVSHLVKKNKRGTYQAVNESSELSDKIKESVTTYMQNWISEQIAVGDFNKLISKEIFDLVCLELSRVGYSDILKK